MSCTVTATPRVRVGEMALISLTNIGPTSLRMGTWTIQKLDDSWSTVYAHDFPLDILLGPGETRVEQWYVRPGTGTGTYRVVWRPLTTSGEPLECAAQFEVE